MERIEFENLLKQSIGLDPATVGSATIESAVRWRMAALCIDASDQYLQKIRQSDEELQELIEAVVVPETWFFRDQEAFASLTRIVTQDWLPNHPGETLRLLSCPCCTGEEPYSMVMALLDAGVPRERLSVDAVDVSTRALNRAKDGVYGQNSFRGDDLSFRDRYFEKVEKGYRLPDWFRSVVRFRSGNVLSSDLGNGNVPYDVIFCRNLLIYFDQDTQHLVMKKLAELLAPSGLLFVGPAEAFLAASNGFTSVNQSMSFAFRKSEATKIPFAVPVPKPALLPKRVSEGRPGNREKPGFFSVPTPAPTMPILVDSTQDRLDFAKKLADTGRLLEAGEVCEAYLRQSGPSPSVYYLLGLVKDSMGDQQSALQCYRRALYLEPNHYEALVQMSLLSERLGDKAAAQKLQDRARRAAAKAGG